MMMMMVTRMMMHLLSPECPAPGGSADMVEVHCDSVRCLRWCYLPLRPVLVAPAASACHAWVIVRDCCCADMRLPCSDRIRQANQKVRPAAGPASLPTLPTQTVSVSAIPASQGQPAGPPVEFVLRACLLVDCVGSNPPQVIGIKTEHMAPVHSVVPQVAAAIGERCVAGVRPHCQT